VLGKGTTFYFLVDLPIIHNEEFKCENIDPVKELMQSYDVSLSTFNQKHVPTNIPFISTPSVFGMFKEHAYDYNTMEY
jgi:hypothetical protein